MLLLYLALPASVKFGMVQVLALPELLEDELLEELEDELLELEEVRPELDEDELDEEELEELDELDEELELDELELDGTGSAPQAANNDDNKSGAAQRLQGVCVVFMLITKCMD